MFRKMLFRNNNLWELHQLMPELIQVLWFRLKFKDWWAAVTNRANNQRQKHQKEEHRCPK